MIEELNKLVLNDSIAWQELSYEQQESFLERLAGFASTERKEFLAFLDSKEIEISGVHAVVYEALGRFSDDSALILSEAKRILELPLNEDEDAYLLCLLDDFDTLEMYERQPAIYMKFMLLASSYIVAGRSTEYLLELLSTFELCYVIPDKPAERETAKRLWFPHIVALAESGPFTVRVIAHQVVKNSGLDITLKPLTFFEKLRWKLLF